jgi:hypothetical protein
MDRTDLNIFLLIFALKLCWLVLALFLALPWAVVKSIVMRSHILI